MAKVLRGKIPMKTLKKIESRAKKEKKNWSTFLRKLLKLAGADPGADFEKVGKKDDPVRVKLKVPKKILEVLKPFMKKHDLDRDEVLGPAIMRGWDLYN